MNTNIIISLDTRKAKQDGSYPLIMRLTHFRKTTSIAIGLSVKKEDWDSQKRQVKRGFEGVSSVARLNNQLAKKKAIAMDVITALDERNELHTVSVSQLKMRITKQSQANSLFSFSEELISDLLETGRFGTALSYKDTLRELKKFTKGIDVTFPEISYVWLTRFEKHYVSKGNSYNALGVYMRTLRAIINKAIKSGIVEPQYYPFSQYRIKTEKTRKRAIPVESIKKILKLRIKKKDELFHVRNYFLASYLMYGMNFADMARLKMSNIIGGRIQYKRLKTGKPYDIKITEQLEKILSCYVQKKEGEEFVFPIIKRQSPHDQYNDMIRMRKAYNKGLKKLADRCAIEELLTSYVSRHSFATEALLKDVPVKAISAMLGHSSLNTTEVYLKGLPSNVLDEYNERIRL